MGLEAFLPASLRAKASTTPARAKLPARGFVPQIPVPDEVADNELHAGCHTTSMLA